MSDTDATEPGSAESSSSTGAPAAAEAPDGTDPSNATAPTWRDFAMRSAAAALTGVFMALGVPDWNLWWLGFFAWLPWLWAIDGQRPGRAFKLGYVSGIVAVFIGYFWMTELLTRFAGMPLGAASGVHLLFSCWQGLQWGLSALVVALIQRRTGRSLLWIVPLSWAAFEAVLPALFPQYMGFMWCWRPRLIQLAEFGGPTVVSFVMLAMNSALYLVLRHAVKERAIDRVPALTLAGLLVGVPLYGTVRMASIDARIDDAPKLAFAVVQGNFGIATFGSRRMKPVILRNMQRMTAELEAKGAEIALWGETAYPYGSFHRESQVDLPERSSRRVRREFTIPLVFGVVTRDRSGDNPYPWNTAWVLEADGTLGDRYDKVFPLMFGESVPLVDPEWYLEMVPTASYLNPGPGPATLDVGEWTLGPLICYEDILPRYARQVARQDVNVLVNLTNDSWFGDSAEQREHLGLAVFRAVEHRKGLVRSVNAGVSAYVDPAGRVVHRTEVTDADTQGPQPPDGFVAEVAMMPKEARSFYARFGDLVNVLFILGLAASFRQPPRRESELDEPVRGGRAKA